MLGGQLLRQQQLGCIQTILPLSEALDHIACIQIYFITMLQSQTVLSIRSLQQLLGTIDLCCMQMLNFHAMFVMADLGNEHTVAGSSEKVLCVIRTHQDGSFDMTPGFNSGGHKCRFEDDFGGCLVNEQAESPSSQPICMSLLNDVVAYSSSAQQSNRAHCLPPDCCLQNCWSLKFLVAVLVIPSSSLLLHSTLDLRRVHLAVPA